MIYGKNNMKKLFTLLLLPLAVCPRVLAQSIAPFQKGDRVTFVGNSITDGGHYHSYIWLYYMTHFPGMRLWMANCGVGGDTAKEILRLKEILNGILAKHSGKKMADVVKDTDRDHFMSAAEAVEWGLVDKVVE